MIYTETGRHIPMKKLYRLFLASDDRKDGSTFESYLYDLKKAGLLKNEKEKNHD